MKTVDLLNSMHAENRSDHAELVRKVDTGFAEAKQAFAAHAREDDTRFNDIKLQLQPLVELRKGVLWAKRSFYGAAGLALVTEVVHIVFTKGN